MLCGGRKRQGPAGDRVAVVTVSYNTRELTATLGLRVAAYPFTADGYVIHRGRGSLAAVLAAGDVSHPLYQWAAAHHDPHFGDVPGADQRYEGLLPSFREATGPLTGTSLASACRPPSDDP
jgi:hypothetical protein